MSPKNSTEAHNDSDLIKLRVTITYVIFHNSENGYTVARADMENGDHTTVVGPMANPEVEQQLECTGEWIENPRYGRQFKAASCRVAMPATEKGIRNFLKSSLMKGIGDKYADSIVDTFGEDTLKILDKEPERLREVSGVGKKRLEQIKQSWAEHANIRELMLFLQSHDVSTAYAIRIFKFYGPEALEVVQENPYRLAMDIPRVGFLTADAIAAKIGVEKESPLRIEAGTLYVLRQHCEQGHVFAPMHVLIGKCSETLDVSPELVEEAIETLAVHEEVKIETLCPSIGRAVYLPAYNVAERSIANRLKALLAAPKTIRPMEAENAINWVQQKLGIVLAGRQRDAVREAAENKVLVITGGPGTGKTTIIIAILRIFLGLQAKTLLAAPTGRAAKRMSEATGHEAKTIHRLLEFSPMNDGFKRDQDNPLNCSLLIIDEASMIDTMLMHHLLKAVPFGATLVLVGDVNQLPSVGAGNVLRDVIESEAAAVVELNEIFRQAKESHIVTYAHDINRGVIPNIVQQKTEETDFYFVQREDPEDVAAMIVEMVRDRIPNRFGFDPFYDIQVLTPMHKGTAGAGNLNLLLQDALNHGAQSFNRGGRAYALGDKVMQVRNNYDKDLFNGDIGRIVELDIQRKAVTISIDDREIPLDVSEMDDIVPAYAVSIHKSQGSEYPAVVVPIITQHFILLQRNLLYTAVTRGKKLVVLVGTQKALAIAVRNNETKKRFTYLNERLAD